MDELFSEADIIFTYTDQEALADGILVDLNAIGASVPSPAGRGRLVNRMTAHLFYDLIPFLVDADHGHGRQPSKLDDLRPGHIASLRSTLATKVKYARDTAQPGEGRDVIYSMPPDLWLVRNEIGGFTAMYPSDY